MDNSNTRENKAVLVSKKHISLFKVLNINIKMPRKYLMNKRKSSSKSKTMNNGKLKIQPLSSKCIRLVTISKRQSSSCFLKRPSKCRSCGMNLNISSSNFSTRLEGPSCQIISQAEKTFWTLVSNIQGIQDKTLENGASLFNFTVMLTTQEKQRMMSTTVTNSQEKNSTGKCLLITLHFSRVKWEI